MSQSPPAGTPVTHRPVLQSELDNIRANIVELTKQVEVAIERAIWGLRDRNPDICTAVIEGDAAINEQHRKIRDACFHAILTQAPVARDLRDIHGFDPIPSEVERVGGHLVSIPRIGRSITELPDVPSSEPLGV